VILAVEDVAQQVSAVMIVLAALSRDRQTGVDFLRRRHGVEGGYVDVFNVDEWS
jgi:hypothetical protein